MKKIPAIVLTLSLLVFGHDCRAAEAVTADTCHSHRKQQLDAVASNREVAAAYLTAEIERTADGKEKASLQAELEQVWDHEEQHHGLAETHFRDCMAFVKSRS